MIGLLYKDLLSMKKATSRIIFVMAIYIVIFTISSNGSSFLSVMIIMLSAMLVMNAFAYDEISKWDYYALALPITKNQLVLSRYVLTLLMDVCGFLLALIPGLIRNRLNTEFMMTIYCVTAAALILMAILLPMLFKFGTQKARIWIFFLFLIPTALVIIGDKMGISLHGITISDAAVESLIWLSLPIALLLFAVSYLISCSVMQKKEF